MSMGFGLGQGIVLGAWTPLANYPAQNFPNPSEDGIITEGGDFLVTENDEFLVTET